MLDELDGQLLKRLAQERLKEIAKALLRPSPFFETVPNPRRHWYTPWRPRTVTQWKQFPGGTLRVRMHSDLLNPPEAT